MKAQLVFTLSDAIKRRKVSHQQLAGAVGMRSKRLSQILQGDFRTTSVDTLLEILRHLGHDIEIVVRPLGDCLNQGEIAVTICD